MPTALHQRANNAGVSTIEAAIRKARTAAHLGAPTKVFEDLLHAAVTSLLAFEFITPSQGGIPLLASGVLVGAVGCSGSSGDQVSVHHGHMPDIEFSSDTSAVDV